MILLPNPDFSNWLIRAIESAKRSIIIVNYLTPMEQNNPKGPVNRIIIALIASAKRGVTVTVILEGSKFRENYAFYRALKDGGADVWMDTSLTFIHTKAVLVDDNILCVGSHNLSANALTRHEEMSMATDDTNAIARFNAEFEKMTAQGIQGGRYIRYMNYFRQNPFYDYDARMAQIETLAEKFSAQVFKRARKLASIVCDDSDLDKINALCALITKSGLKAAESAARKISNLAANSTKRKFEYVEELLVSGARLQALRLRP